MTQLIQLTMADTGSSSFISSELTVGVRNILMIEDYHGNHGEQSRIYLENGKSLYVTESQSEIRDLANG